MWAALQLRLKLLALRSSSSSQQAPRQQTPQKEAAGWPKQRRAGGPKEQQQHSLSLLPQQLQLLWLGGSVSCSTAVCLLVQAG